MARRLRSALVVSFAVLTTLFVLGARDARAGGWQEVHESGDDVRVKVAPDGIAVVEHHLRYRVVAGRFKAFELPAIDPRGEMLDGAVVGTAEGGELAAAVEPDPKHPGARRVSIVDAPKGLGRGVYTVDVKYKLDLVAAKALVRDGAMWRLAWTAPPAAEGRDGTRVVFEVPTAPTEPRLAVPEEAETTLPTLRRLRDTDEVELVRAHVPRGEAVTWSIRVDPKAFPGVSSPALRPPPRAPLAATDDGRAPIAVVAAALALVAGALAAALRHKRAVVAEACAARGAKARPLVALPHGLAPFAYGAASAGALATLLWGDPLAGASLVVVAMVLAAHRAPVVPARPRGPGRWETVLDAEVLVGPRDRAARGDALDLGTRRGRVTAIVLAAAIAAAAFLLRLRLAGAVVAIPIAAAAVVPLFATGTRAELPPRPHEIGARVLRATRDALARLVDLAHVEIACIARLGRGAPQTGVDEVRLACAPVDRIPGLRAIELAVATPRGAPSAALPEVLVRFDDGSEAAAKIAEIARGRPVVPGRTTEERVLAVAPDAPTSAAAARVLARLLAELEERRFAQKTPSWTGPERRKPRPPRTVACAPAPA